VSRSKIEEDNKKKELHCLINYLRPRLYLKSCLLLCVLLLPFYIVCYGMQLIQIQKLNYLKINNEKKNYSYWRLWVYWFSCCS